MRESRGYVTPTQPYLPLQTKGYQRILAGEEGISHFYEFTVDKDNEEILKAVPDGSVDLLFSMGEKNFHTYVGGTVLKVKNWPMEADRVYFGVRFQPGKCRLPKELSIQDVVNNDLEVDGNFYGENLLEKLWEEPDLASRAKVFAENYRKMERKNRQKLQGRSLEEYIRGRIYETNGMITIRELSQEMGYSECYIRREFGKVHGISPKLFEKFVRFQNVIKILDSCSKEKNRIPFDELAIACGYYDQPHMIKDFKTFCGVTPEVYTKMMTSK